MTSSLIVKGVSSFITPLKPSKAKLLSSPININRKCLSASFKKPVLTSCHFGSSTRHSKTLKNKSFSFLSEERSPTQKAVRCLFSPQRSPKSLSDGKFCSTTDFDELPSFDTPLRKSISSKEFYKKNVESFVLGRGSYGLVVEGRYKNKRVAVKMMSKCQDHTDVLKSEANALKLQHPNIIQVFQVIPGIDKNIGFVFMEYYSNVNLEHILQCEIVSYLEKLIYLKQIGSALQFCHTNGILHLDVKPKNIIVKTKSKCCKLCDFGSSVYMFDETRTNNFGKGTLKYTAPELLKGERPTEKSDVYSFGITMWQTIYQEVPYDKENLQQVVYKVVKQDYRPECKADYHPAVGRVYEACWRANPQHRPSMAQVLLMME